MTWEAGFDAQANRDALKDQKRPPVLSPNRRKTKQPSKIAQTFRWLDRRLYGERAKVERPFGGQDTYRQLVVSEDRLPAIRKGGRLLA